METFAEVLSHYVQRAGISDTELARAVGVSRQTIFRWREGLTGRPNNREDVLAIAEKLRLLPEERDHLLLVAGFRPEDLPALENGEINQQSAEKEPAETLLEVQSKSDVSEDESKRSASYHAETEDTKPTRKLKQPRYRWVFIGSVGVLLSVLLVWVIIGADSGNAPDEKSGITPTSNVTVKQSPSSDLNDFIPAAQGETLIVVTQFEDTGESESITYRFVDALEREIYGSRIENIRVDVWPEITNKSDKASLLITDSGAALVAYGKYDAGQALVQFFPNLDQSVGVSEFAIGTSSNLQLEIRSLALMTLGHLYSIKDDRDQAVAFLAQARNVLQSNPEGNENIAVAVDALMLQVHSDIQQ